MAELIQKIRITCWACKERGWMRILLGNDGAKVKCPKCGVTGPCKP